MEPWNSAIEQEGSMRPPAPSAAPSLARPTVRSGLRPPMIRASTAGSSALPRPAGTGIPRPSSLSRIPPPKVRCSTLLCYEISVAPTIAPTCEWIYYNIFPLLQTFCTSPLKKRVDRWMLLTATLLLHQFLLNVPNSIRIKFNSMS